MTTASTPLVPEEHFAWLNAHGLSDTRVLGLRAGPGYLTMKPRPGSAGSIAHFEAEHPGGALLSATCVAELVSGTERRFVLIRRDLEAPVSPGCWQIPAGRCSPGESPLLTAVRELDEEVGIEGVAGGWSAACVRREGSPVRYSTPEGVLEFEGQWAWHHATYEFFVRLELHVPAFEAVRLWDREPYGRQVALFTARELIELFDTRQLAMGSAAVVREMLARSQLNREMRLGPQDRLAV